VTEVNRGRSGCSRRRSAGTDSSPYGKRASAAGEASASFGSVVFRSPGVC
jgi:hypothetical protein